MAADLQVALAKSKGNLSMAIELLQKHVDVFMLDKASWEELGELYLQVCTCKPMQPCCGRLWHPDAAYCASTFRAAY